TLGFVLLLTGEVALASKVKTEYRGQFTLASLKRFAFAADTATNSGTAESVRIREGLIAVLDARGFVFSPAPNADFLLACHIGSSSQTQQGAAAAYEASRYTDGAKAGRSGQETIIVEFFDATDKRLIWRGRLSAKLKAVGSSGMEVEYARAFVDQFLKDA